MRFQFNTYIPTALALSALLFGCSGTNQKKLPIIGEPTTTESVVDGKTVIDSVYPQIPVFSFINQDSVAISEKNFDNKIYVADFFFTHCPSICPTMQRNLLKVYEKYKGDERLAFLSHSIDFKYDTPSVLKAYANKLGVTNDQWQFVTGSQKDIYGIAEKYLVFAEEDENAPGGYNHQGYLVLVDTDKHIRGAYDGTSDEQIQQLQEDIETLLNESN